MNTSYKPLVLYAIFSEGLVHHAASDSDAVHRFGMSARRNTETQTDHLKQLYYAEGDADEG